MYTLLNYGLMMERKKTIFAYFSFVYIFKSIRLDMGLIFVSERNTISVAHRKLGQSFNGMMDLGRMLRDDAFNLRNKKQRKENTRIYSLSGSKQKENFILLYESLYSYHFSARKFRIGETNIRDFLKPRDTFFHPNQTSREYKPSTYTGCFASISPQSAGI